MRSSSSSRLGDYAKDYAKETTHETVPGVNVKEEEEMAEENKMTENMAEQQFSAKQRHEGHKG